MNAISPAHDVLAEEVTPQTHPLFVPVARGIETINGKDFMHTADGGLALVSKIKPQDLLQDEMVRKVFGFALPLSGFIARFVQHTFNDADALVELLDQQYGVKRGGTKGNLTFTTIDNLMKVEVSKAKIIEFGAPLAQAKALLDECVADWSSSDTVDDNLKALLTRAFNIENGGLVNRSALFSLLRFEINDERWKRAMQAIQDAIEVKGTKRYVRLYMRATTDEAWVSVSLDAARA